VDVLIERCAGIDIGKNEVVACVRTPAPDGRGRRKQTRTFATFTGALEEMADWFGEQGVTDIAMEATGPYWKPVWYVLEERTFQLRLVNAHHVKILPGRKSDVLDAEWLAELLEHGLLRASFVPPPAIRELRDLTRYRKRLIQAHTAETQRIQKTLEDAGIKLDSVASDVLGASGRAMLDALIAGERDPVVLAELARGTLRRKIPALRQALRGRFRDHHALLIGLCREHTDYLDAAIARLDERIDALIAEHTSEAGLPFARARDRLTTITGVGKRAAECILAEIGADMTRFPSPGHLASWPPGPAWHPGSTKPAASPARARPPTATSGSPTSSPSAPGPPPAPARPTCPRSSGGWPAGSARRRRPSRSATPSWSSAGTC
jgi:transposase